MSLRARMKPLTLQSKVNKQSPSGQQKATWRDAKTIFGTLSPTGGNKTNSNNHKYTESTHTCITYEKDISEANRIVDGSVVYEIIIVNDRVKFTEVLLKKVNFNV